MTSNDQDVKHQLVKIANYYKAAHPNYQAPQVLSKSSGIVSKINGGQPPLPQAEDKAKEAENLPDITNNPSNQLTNTLAGAGVGAGAGGLIGSQIGEGHAGIGAGVGGLAGGLVGNQYGDKIRDLISSLISK